MLSLASRLDANESIKKTSLSVKTLYCLSLRPPLRFTCLAVLLVIFLLSLFLSVADAFLSVNVRIYDASARGAIPFSFLRTVF